MEWATAAGAECLEVTEPIIAKLAARDNPQNVMAVFEQRWADLPSAVSEPADATWLALEEVRDPGNLGTIIRTADAVGARGIILIGASCDPYSPEATRATMGSIFSVPLVRMQPHSSATGSSAGRAMSSARIFPPRPIFGRSLTEGRPCS